MSEKYERGSFVFEETENVRTIKDIETEMLKLEEEEILKLKRKITYCDGMKYLRSQKTIDKIEYRLRRRSDFGGFTKKRDDYINEINVIIEIWVNSKYMYKKIEIDYNYDNVKVKTDYEPYKVYCKKIMESLMEKL